MNNFYPYSAFLNRLKYAVLEKNKKVVFLLGAPVSAPRDGNPGVVGVDGIVEIVRNYFEADKDSLCGLDKELANASLNAYQVGVNFLLGYRGQDAVNDLIRRAVIGARLDSQDVLCSISTNTNLSELAERLEAEKEKWYVPQCLRSLAELIGIRPSSFGLQLTTNFDPLLSLAIQSQGGQCFRSVLCGDGSINQTQGDGCHVVHLHGYWRGGVDTLHTPKQLAQPRPKLKSSLGELLKNNLVVPIAYSGWDDVFTQTLLELAGDDLNKLDVLWTYHGENDADLISQNKRQLSLFESVLSSGRLLLYKGVDCYRVFDDLLDLVKEASPLDGVREGGAFVVDCKENGLTDAVQSEPSTTDTIPQVVELFGRGEELATVADRERNKIITISGIGGQGKSSLAALYALNSKKSSEFMFVDWRDCREYDNTFISVLVRSIHYISEKVGDQIPMESLREASIESLCAAFLRVVENNVGVVVFDNVDQYVDLESGEPIHELRILIDALVRSALVSQVFFTSRPRLNVQADMAVAFKLQGLDEVATKQLFESKNGGEIEVHDLCELWRFTEGHPLWISLIASKCRHEKKRCSSIVADISAGKGDLPERTILSIWNGLSDKQKIVLRMLAELERPLSEEEFSQIDFELNYNQIAKALKNLKLLSLVEVREGGAGASVIDLHPLIRQYVRKNFPRTERQKFIARIIYVIDRKISAAGQIVKGVIPLSLVDLRLHKATLSLNQGNCEGAISALDGLFLPLVENGMAEDFVRQAIRVFEQVDWLVCCAQGNPFNGFWSHVIKAMVELDKLILADKYLDAYEKSIQGKGAQFINLCDAKCYRYWFCGDFEQAIYYGLQGELIQKQTGVDTGYSCSHNLALSWRDNRECEKALDYFLGQVEESEVLDPNKIDQHKNGSFYGNIGRCLFFMGRLDDAIVCYKKSASLLENYCEGGINRGYIRHWVGELLFQKGQLEDGAIFLRAALEVWHNLSPRRSERITAMLNDAIENNPHLIHVMDMPRWRLENRFIQWMGA